MKRIIEYLPILTGCLLYFGFCNLYFYFKEFKIEIHNYISNSEILLSFLPIIVTIISLFYAYAIQTTFSKADQNRVKDAESDSEKEEEIEIVPKSRWQNVKSSIWFYILIYYFIWIGIRLMLVYSFHYREYELQTFYLFGAIIFYTIILLYLTINNKKNVVTDNVILFGIFLIVYISNDLKTYRRLDALKIKNGISDKSVSFNFKNKPVHTSKELIFIGQTQNNIFLYDRKDSSTKVFKIQEIDSFSIK